MKFTGISIAITNLLIFYKISLVLRENVLILQEINNISYYWLMFTILVGIWEFYYVKSKNIVNNLSKNLLLNNDHVWFLKYSLKYLLPWNFSNIFYAEYAAYADREYMYLQDNWSKVIEGSHAVCCGLLSLIGIIFKIFHQNDIINLIFFSMAMGCQFMNSILYMYQYYIQTKLTNNINYNSDVFPCGKFLIKRPFMYINIFWTIMPIYVVYKLIKSYYFVSDVIPYHKILNSINYSTKNYNFIKFFKLYPHN